MARPKRTIQRKPSGIYQAVIWVNGTRHAKSLETRDERTATKRAAQAVRELEAIAQGPGIPRWEADEPAIEYALDSKGNVVDEPIHTTWGKIAEPEDLKVLGWRDLITEAVKLRKRKKGEDYSDGWYAGVGYATQRAPFSPLEASPPLIRKWINELDKGGMTPRTIEINCAYLRSLIKISMKSGLLHDIQVNPFSLVDFSTEEVRHIPTMLQADYIGLGQMLPDLPKVQRVAMLTQAFTGTRYSEIKRRGAVDFDLKAGTFTIEHDPGKGKGVKNKHSRRTIPLPEALIKELDGFDFNWPSMAVVNKKLKMVNPELSSHSFRHGLIRLNRDLGGDADVLEAYVGHSLKGMKDVYGDGFSLDRFREVLTPAWASLHEWLNL